MPQQPFTIPLLQRIIRFSCRDPTQAVFLSYVDTTFRETIIDYETGHLVFAACNARAKNARRGFQKHSGLLRLQKILRLACASSSGFQWLIPVLLQVPIMRPMFRINRDQTAWMFERHYEPMPPLFIAIENRNFYAIDVIVDFALKYLHEDRKSVRSKQDRDDSDDDDLTNRLEQQLSPKQRAARYHFACEIKNQLVGHVGEMFSMFDFLVTPEFCAKTIKKHDYDNHDRYYNRVCKEKLELIQFIFAKLQKFTPSAPKSKEMRLDARFLLTRSPTGETLLTRWLVDINDGKMRNLDNIKWLLSAAESVGGKKDTLEELLEKRDSRQYSPLFLAVLTMNNHIDNLELVRLIFDKIECVSKHFLGQQLTRINSSAPGVHRDGIRFTLLVNAILYSHDEKIINEILKRTVVAGIRHESIAVQSDLVRRRFGPVTLAQLIFRANRPDNHVQIMNVLKLIIAFCKDGEEFQKVVQLRESFVHFIRQGFDDAALFLEAGDCFRKSKEWYKEYFGEEVYIGE